ncbi:MAG: phosphatase PAP2 family protein [Cytophagales bacterium]|nr:phosphatase PAP2 family protein [Cytophagales bacterium]
MGYSKFLGSDPFAGAVFKRVLAGLTLAGVAALLIPKGADVVWINSRHHGLLDYFFSAITLLGDGIWILPALAIVLFIRFEYAIQFMLSGVLCGALVSLGKRVLFAGAGRPITLLDHSLLHFVEGVKVHSHHSFPSGHTATAFVVAVGLAIYLKNKHATIVLLLLACLVGYSRMYLLQHFLVDVVGGAAIGVISVYTVYAIKPFHSKKWARQKLQVGKRKQLEPVQN